MKKILLLMVICGLGFTGCAVRVATSVKAVDVPETVRPLPLTADLNISEQKVRGEAIGRLSSKSGEEERIIREAVARALGQDPPKSEAPDVLVAMNVYKELNGKNLTVVVTGYPAWYYNFRTVEPDDSARLILVNTNGDVRRGGSSDGLPFAAPEQMSLGAPLRPIGPGAIGKRYYLGVNTILLGSRTMTGEWAGLEAGLRGRNDLSYGLEFGGGYFGKSDSDRGKSRSMGGGFNIARTYDLPSNGGSLVYGMSAGFWYGYFYKYKYDYEHYDYQYIYSDENQDDYLFGGPFLKYRWKIIELSYRGLMGMREERDNKRYYFDRYRYYRKYTYQESFALASQFKVGLYFNL